MSDVDLVQVTRAIEQQVQGAHAGVGAVVQFVTALPEAALWLVAGRASGTARNLKSLDLAEQLGHGFTGRGRAVVADHPQGAGRPCGVWGPAGCRGVEGKEFAG